MGTRRSIVVALCDPRLMLAFRKVAGKLGITYSIPRVGEKSVEADVVIVDEECLEDLEVNAAAAYLVNSVEDVRRVTYEVAGVRGEKVMLVGVDIGLSLAYVILAGGVLIDKGKVKSPEALALRVRSYQRELGVHETIVKVGIPESSSYDGVFKDVVNVFLEAGCRVYAVDEKGTSTRPIPAITKLLGRGDSDINAAANIALREGTRVI